MNYFDHIPKTNRFTISEADNGYKIVCPFTERILGTIYFSDDTHQDQINESIALMNCAHNALSALKEIVISFDSAVDVLDDLNTGRKLLEKVDGILAK